MGLTFMLLYDLLELAVANHIESRLVEPARHYRSLCLRLRWAISVYSLLPSNISAVFISSPLKLNFLSFILELRLEPFLIFFNVLTIHRLSSLTLIEQRVAHIERGILSLPSSAL